jgi:penicillin amidase
MGISKIHVHFVSSFFSVAIVFVVFSSALGPLPPLGDFLDPTGGGIFGVAQDSEHPTFKELYYPNLKGDVTVYRDNKGIPYVYAEFDSDLFFVVGYLQAQDRLFQLDITRRLFSGTLSEVLGNRTLGNDIFMRSVGLMRVSEDLWKAVQEETDPVSVKMVESINAYSAGINQYIAENHPLPFEFQLLGYSPTAWNPVDSIAFAKYMSFSLGFGEGELDLIFAELVEGLGVETAYDLFPYGGAPLQIPVIPDYGGYEMPDKYSFAENGSNSTAEIVPQFKSENPDISQKKLPIEVLQGVRNVRAIIEDTFTTFGFLFDQTKGSNNWVVSQNKSATGSPILANDMHLQWSVPSIWYQISYFSKESGLSAWGFMFIGSPMIVAGHNKDIAWGFTNVGGDVLDWYYYKENDQGQYYYNGEWKTYQTVDEVIKIKGKEPFTYTIRLTPQGSEIAGRNYNGRSLVASWIGTKDYVTELGRKFVFKAVYGFNFASNYNEFKAAVSNWDGPAQNIVYADKSNIALWVAGVHPSRTSSIDGRLPINGSVSSDAWQGYIEPEDWPHSINPTQGYLASANQKSVGPNYPYYIGSYHAEGYRARRINYVLNNDTSVTIEDMKNLQTDTVDTSAEAFVPFLLEAIANNPSFGSEVPTWEAAVRALKSWDYDMDKDETAPLIYQFFIENYQKFTFSDEWSASGIELDRYPQRVFLENLSWKDPNSVWFDNVSTEDIVETRDDVLLTAFKAALEELDNELGDFSNWVYGVWHKGYFESLILLKALSSDQVPISGSRYTVNPSGGKIAKAGASERAIYDLSDLSKSIASLPGGQRANPTSKNYLDLLYDYFLKLEYYEQTFYLNQNEFPTDLIESTLIFRRAS